MSTKKYSDKHVIAAQQKEKEKDYWLEKLSGDLIKSSFPCDFKRQPGDAVTSSVSMRLAGDIFLRLKRLSNNSDIMLHMVLAAGVIVLLGKYTHINDVIIGIPIYRQEVETDFINTVLPLRIQVDKNMTFKELLNRVRKTIIEANENQNYPFEILLDHLGMPITENNNPLLSTVMLLENIQDRRYIKHLYADVIFLFRRTEESVDGKIEYNSSLYKNITVETIRNHYRQLLRTAINNVDCEISSIYLLSGEEQKQILYHFNKFEEPFPGDMIIDNLFEKQVGKTPDCIAIAYEDRQLTYEGLNKEANQLAHLLKEKGVKAGHIIGLMVHRSIEMIVAILGILKAGGAYLPIDPYSPKSRILFMLEECRAAILLTQKEAVKNHSFTSLQDIQKIIEIPHVTTRRQQITDFDNVPIPNRSLVDYEIYSRNLGQAIFKHCISLQATRGCPYQCLYCHKIWPKNHVFRSAENIFEEILLYYKLGVKRFSLIDDIFNLNEKNSSRLFQLIIKNKLDVQLAFPNGVRGDILTKDYIDLMVEAGTVIVAFALETASPRLQKLVGKNLNLEKFRGNLEYFCATYPVVIIELFTMIGFPTETTEEALMTLNFIKGIKWLHFPYVFILKIFPNTEMAKFALENGVPFEHITASDDLLYNELPETLPFEKKFTLKYQADFFNNYFLSKERLLHVLPYQMKLLSEDEIAKAYDAYLPNDIYSFPDLLDSIGVTKEELASKHCQDDSTRYIPDIQEKMRACFPTAEPEKNALRVLLLDLSQFFSENRDIFYNTIEPPLGLMYLMTYLKQQLGGRVDGRIAKSRIDFDNFGELKKILEDFKPDVIGLRTLTLFKDFFHMVVAMIRQWGFQLPLIAGGPYATSSYQTILQDGHIDLVVLGEGEITFCQLIEHIINNNGKLPEEETLKEIAGIAFIPHKPGRIRTAREIIILDESMEVISTRPGENLRSSHSTKNLAYTVYTSGSTGKPKGVPITHANISPLLHWGYKHLDLGPGQRTVQNLSYFFDWSVWEIFITLTSGACLSMVSMDVLLDPEVYTDFFYKHNITVLHITPTQFQSLIHRVRKLETLKYLCLGAEKLTTEMLLRSIASVNSNCRIFNMYGPTEATIMTAVLEIDNSNGRQFEGLSSVPIGKPIANAELVVLDKKLHLTPINVRGELYIAGDCLAKGYLNDPGVTAKKFIKNIFANVKGEKLYATGDVVRWLSDGNLEFLGRRDHQVKLRGFRIELAEIENRLMNHPGIKEALVTVIEEDEGEKDKYLSAYYIPHTAVYSLEPGRDADDSSAGQLDASQLRAYLLREIPAYMIPSHFTRIKKFPLNPNGKVDIKALPGPERNDSAAARDNSAPADKLEKKLEDIWAEVLGIKKSIIRIEGDFFKLGGNSLNATKIVSKIHQELQVKVSLKDFFITPELKELVKFIKEEGKGGITFAPVNNVEKKEYYQLSSAQKRLYTLQRFDMSSTSYNIPIIVELEGMIQKEKMESTFRDLINRHESFRTSFGTIEGKTIQVVHEAVEFAIGYYERKREDAEEMVKHFIRTFDLGTAPLLRVSLIKIGDSRYILAVDMHHIISDAASMEIFVNEFVARYNEEKLPALKLQYKDFSKWQNSKSRKGEIKKQEKYWLNVFAGEIPVLDLPTDFPRPAIQSFEGNSIRFQIGNDETGQLNKIAKDEGTTMFMVLLTVFNIFLSKLSGQDDIIVGTVTSGRSQVDLNYVIGMFVNTLPLRNQPGNKKTFRGFLNEVKKQTLDAFENQDYQFEDLVDRLALEREPNRNPLFGVMFSLNNEIEEGGISDVESVDFKLIPYEYDTNISKFDFTLSGVEAGGEIYFTFRYSTKLYMEETINVFAEYLKQIISCALENPDQKISRMEIIPETEKEVLLSQAYVNLENE